MTEQKLWHVIVQESGLLDAKERTVIEDIFAEGWAVKEMVSLNADGHVLFLMERTKPGMSGSGPRPF